MTYPISDVTRRVVYSGSLGTGPYPFLFEILTSADIGVYKNTTLLTLSADYTVTINADGTGSVTLTSAATSTDTISIFGNKGIQRQTDFTTGGDLFANSLNDELDAQTIFAQQNSEAILRSIRAPVTDPTTVDMILPSANSRADSVLTFDTNGDVQATSTSTFVAGLSGSILGANYVTNNATGDGSTTAFTVSTAPGSKTNIQIYIDGVYQNKASFSVSGTTVTFTQAPPLNSSIEFMIGYAIGSASGAGSITFTQAGTGAVTRTVESKLQDVVSVKDFGAVGDGVTDDTAAIQAAIDAASVLEEVVFPQATYKCNSTINAKGRCLIGAGKPELDFSGLTSGNNAIFVEYNVANFGWRIENFTISMGGNGQDAININNGQNWLLNNIRINDAGRDGIRLQGTSGTSRSAENFTIRKVDIDTTNAACLHLMITDGATVNYINEGLIDSCEFRQAGTAEVLLEVDNNTGGAGAKISSITFNQCNADIRSSSRATPYLIHCKRTNSSNQAIEHIRVYGGSWENTSTPIASSYVVYADSGITASRFKLIDIIPAGVTGLLGGDTIDDLFNISYSGGLFLEEGALAVGNTSASVYKLLIDRDGSSGTGYIQQWTTENGGSLSLQTDDLSLSNPQWRLSVGSGESMELYAGAPKLEYNSTGLGFFGSTPSGKPTITGSTGGNAALQDLLSKLATLGLITDSTT